MPARRPPLWRHPETAVVAVIALGGVVGALARWAAGVRWPTPAGHFPLTTLVVNVVGCALIGVLLVLVTEVVRAHRLVRPALGTGVLGGFTTFSTWAVDSARLATGGHPVLAVADVVGTIVAALAAVAAGMGLTRLVAARVPRRGPGATP